MTSSLYRPTPKFLNVSAVAAMFGVSVSTIWRLNQADDGFPKPYKLGPRCSRWKVAELEEYSSNLRRSNPKG